MTLRYKEGMRVIVTKASTNRGNYNVVGAVGVVVSHKTYFPQVDFGGEVGVRTVDPARIKLHHAPPTKIMEIGKRYRQNSTGSEAICIGHDQGKCVVRFIDDKNRNGQDRYQVRCGKVGNHQYHWTEIGKITHQLRKVEYHTNSESITVREFLNEGEVPNVAFTFEDGKLINVTMLNN